MIHARFHYRSLKMHSVGETSQTPGEDQMMLSRALQSRRSCGTRSKKEVDEG